MEEKKTPQFWNTERPSVIKWFRRVFSMIVVLLLVIILLLQFSQVQTWLGQKVTAYISKATNTHINAQRIKINPLDGIILQQVDIIDDQKDTILHLGALNISLRKNLFFLFKNQLDLSYIGIKDVKLHILTELGEKQSNFSQFLERLSSSDKNKTGTNPLLLDVKEIDLSKIDILIDDKNKGKYQQIKLKSGHIDINYLDLACNEYDISYILLDSPYFQSVTYDYACYSEDTNNSDETNNSSLATDKNPLVFLLKDLSIKNGFFGIQNKLVMPDTDLKDQLDYKNFFFRDLNLIVTNTVLRDGQLTSKIEGINAEDNTGYQIRNIKSDTVFVTNETIQLNGLIVDMGKTKITDRFRMNFADFTAFSDFSNEVIINAELKSSKVHLRDLAHFVKGLEKVPVIKKNMDEIIDISGRYYGKINNLGGRDVAIKLGDKMNLKGTFNTRDLLDPANTVLNIKLDRFETSMRRLKMVIPNFNPPDNFYKLGSINFTGRFDGYLEDFVAYGKLRTDIGNAELDMRLDITSGEEKANYSGTLNVNNFNLGIWADNKDIGLVSFRSKVNDGRGLTLNTVKADLNATVNSLIFKKYNYKDFVLNGKINKNTFKGGFRISDENVDFIFKGNVEYLNNRAFLNFKSEVNKLDLFALNLSKNPLAFKGNMELDVSGTNINDFTGNIDISALNIMAQDTIYNVEKLKIESKNTVNKTRLLMLDSDLGKMTMDGKYDLPNVVKAAKKIILTNYPLLTKDWKVVAENLQEHQKFDFNIQIKDSKNFLSLAGLNNSYFNNLSLKGRIDTYKSEISIASEIPLIRINNDSLQNIQLLVSSDKKEGDILIHIDSTYVIGRKFNPIDLQTKMKGDTISFAFSTDKIIDTLETFDIKGTLVPHLKGYDLSFTDNLMVLLGTTWKIDSKNNATFGKGYISLENMIISDGSRSFELNDVNNNKGLTLDISNFDLNILNGIIKYDKMKFAGNSNISGRLEDLYAEDKQLSGYVNVPQFTVNGDPYGSIFIDATKLKNVPFKANISIGDFLAIKATYDEKLKFVDSKIKLRQAPLKLLEYLLKDGIKNTSGYINADLVLTGAANQLNLSGEGIVQKGKATLKYTGATYSFDQQKFRLSNKLIDLDGARISDQNGSIGVIRGGLTHDLFKNMGVNATITGNNVVALNTTKADNPSYYGYGVGPVTAEFKGLFSKVNMKINATSGPGTKLFIPVGNTQSTIDQNFIKFVKKGDQSGELKKNTAIEGINIEMTITITPEAELSLIFNEAKGDIIRGTGRGNMKIDITREGDFEIFGNYEIEQGQYLFTVALLPVAKPFVVQRGGSIRWTGDPVNATLDMTANYRARTPIEQFINEYLTLASTADINLARQNTEVDLKLKLGGTLYKPEIKFDLAFPNLTGDVANFAESKLRSIRSNELELNGQAMGLIVFNSFLPSNRVSDAFGTAGIQSASVNTLSEFLTSQLSVYITNIINSRISENGFISGVDFGMNVRNNNYGFVDNDLIPDEIGFRNTVFLKNDRISLDVGGNYVLQNQGRDINQILLDFAVEFRLTEDRRLKVRLYGKNDLDPVNFTELREKYGLGMAYRAEFGAMTDLDKVAKRVQKDTILQ